MVTLLFALLQPAAGYSRMHLPEVVATAQADAIVVATIVSVDSPARWQQKAVIQVERSLLGTAPDRLEVLFDAGPQQGQTWIVHLVEVDGAWKALLDGTSPHSAELEAQRKEQIAARPSWPAPVDGWSAVLVLGSPAMAPTEQLDAWVVYRNLSDQTQSLAYQEWPKAEHCHWTLTVTRDGTEVAPLAHPHLTEAEITAYFSAHGNSFQQDLKPGESFALPLQRINSAEPGWGYKQRLGFRYWPMAEPGTYAISAVESGFAGREPLKLPGGTVVVSTD